MDETWEWYFSPTTEQLLKLEKGTWHSFPHVIKRNKLPAFANRGTPTDPPSDICRATVYMNREHIICTGYDTIVQDVSRPNRSLIDCLLTTAPGEHWCVSNALIQGDGNDTAQAILQGEAIAVSNGSFKDQYGTAAWVIEGNDHRGRISGAVIVPGNAEDQSSYRSELAGIYSIFIAVKHICQFFNIQSGSIELGCDGESAIDKVFNYVAIIRMEDSNYDLLHSIKTLWAHSPLHSTFRHIKGHQDDHTPVELLDQWARLNIEMDDKAKKYMPIAKRSPRHHSIFSEPWCVWAQGKKILTNWTNTLYDIAHSAEAKEYWSKKDDIPIDTLDTVNWEAIHIAMKESKRSQRVFISKHACGMCGVGKFMERWKLRKDSACTRCGEHEDSPHVWLCKEKKLRIFGKTLSHSSMDGSTECTQTRISNTLF
jgi:hypothetical protein